MMTQRLIRLAIVLLSVHLFTSNARSDEPGDNADSGANFALEFDGGECVVVPQLTYDGRHPITLEAIARPYHRTDEYTRSTVVGNLQLSGLGIHYKHGFIYFNINDGRTQNLGYASAGYGNKTPPDKTIHVAGVFDGKTVKFFVDGMLQRRASEVTDLHVPSPYDFMVGADPGDQGEPHQFFKGVIDEVRISKVARYNKDFTPERRFQPDKDTLLLYHFDEGKGKIAHDESGNDYHGSIQGAKWVKLDAE